MIPFTAKAPKRALVEAVASKSIDKSDLGGGDERFYDNKVAHGVHLCCVKCCVINCELARCKVAVSVHLCLCVKGELARCKTVLRE
jgi:hypothetical protein